MRKPWVNQVWPILSLLITTSRCLLVVRVVQGLIEGFISFSLWQRPTVLSLLQYQRLYGSLDGTQKTNLSLNCFGRVYGSFGIGFCYLVAMDSNMARNPYKLDILIMTVSIKIWFCIILDKMGWFILQMLFIELRESLSISALFILSCLIILSAWEIA
jgi:hypothetical protein